MWKKVFFYFSKIFIYTCQLWKIFVLREKAVYNFVKTLYQWLKTLLSFFAFFVFSKNFLSKVCVDCCRLCEELALASSAAKGDNHQLEATSRNSITSITLLCNSRNSITLLMPLVEILSLCSCQ